ncbi:MAG: Na/Pi cotransporter family protein [Deltaproteobacteria bacterium]|nr:Na/Pi cotransporter family protein [Deltaproteobacteria bacterium]
MNNVQMVITVVGGLAFFLFGMKTMSEGLQKVAGAKMRRILSVMTNNRLAGVGTGFLVTSAVQSSSATTVMLVGFVSAGLITLNQSIGVIMGANIGTTFTGWLVALLGFKVKITAMALPAVALGFFPRFFGLRRLADWGEVLVGFGILFIGLDFMKDSVTQLRESEMLLAWMSSCRADLITWRLLAVLVGALVTMLVQSSSATMVITMTLAAQGLINLPTACALVLGENIGTTVTANLAAIGASTSARRAARAHLIFNLTGALWAVLLFTPFLGLINAILPGAESGDLSQAAIATRLAAFHSVFNVINTGVFLPFTSKLAWLAGKLVPTKGEDETKLKFIDPSIISTPPMAIHAARSELARMLEEVESMLSRVLMLIASPDKKLNKVAEAIAASEKTVDVLEKEITAYLVSVARLETSQRQSREITGIVGAVSDIERMGDHCEILLKLLRRLYDEKLSMGDEARKEATEIGEQVSHFIELLRKNILKTLNGTSDDLIAEARRIEDSIDTKHKRMREGHMERLRQGSCDVDSGLVFIDMLTSFEKIGDHAFNVAEMLSGAR